MKVFIETDRLILREILPEDVEGMFELDSDSDVHKYLGNKPIKNPKEALQMIEFIRSQYRENKIGRWAVIEKETESFIGWAGLKLIREKVNNHSRFHDVGYRLIKRYWGKGYATEATKASIQYAFHEMKLDHIYATVHKENAASKKVLIKAGLQYIETFDYHGVETDWFKISAC